MPTRYFISLAVLGLSQHEIDYRDMDEGEFLDEMTSHELMDIANRAKKAQEKSIRNQKIWAPRKFTLIKGGISLIILVENTSSKLKLGTLTRLENSLKVQASMLCIVTNIP